MPPRRFCSPQTGPTSFSGARRAAELENIAAWIAEGGHGTATVLPGDVRGESYAQSLVDLAVARFGRLDGAFNNAGIVGDMHPAPDMALGTWNEIIAVNLTSAFLAAKAQIPVMKKQRSGSIVFTSAFVGFSIGALLGMAAYAADGIGINALVPGGTVTPAGGADNRAVLDFVANLHPIKRMAEAREIAQAALFLLSDRSSFVT